MNVGNVKSVKEQMERIALMSKLHSNHTVSHSLGLYDFDCKCSQCLAVTKYFHLKSKDEAIKLGYQSPQVTLRRNSNE